MAPTGKKTAQATRKQQDGGFPGLKAHDKADTKTPYDELQREEVTVLQAIYGDDFIEHEATHGAWKKSEPTFDIRIKASADDDFAMTLGVVLGATYPKSPPRLTIKDSDGLRDSIRFKIQKFVETQPKDFARDEQVMIDRIVEAIREILEDAAQKKAKGVKLPSLEEERAAHEAYLAKLAQDEKERQERQKLEESKEEERHLGDMLEEELRRRKTKAKESRMKYRSQQLSADRSAEDLGEADEALLFDQPCKLTDESGNTLYFQTVVGKTLFREGPVTAVYKVKPVLSARQARPSLALKQVEVKSHGKDSAQFKKQLQSLEAQLETLKKVRHHRVLQLVDFRIDRGISETDSASPTVWTISVLAPIANKGSLDELLELAGNLDLGKARIWAADLLEALAFLHSNGLVHQDIHPRNILLCREPAGDIVPKITDTGYQRELHNICATSSTLNSTRTAKSAYWFPPEIAGASRPQYTQKTDVWDLGIVFLQMLFGLDIPQKYRSPSVLIDSLSLSASLKELLSKLFKSDSKKRPRAFELSSSEFLATNASLMEENTSAVEDSMTGPAQPFPRRLRHDSMNINPDKPSRFVEDYTIEGHLGKGGFGEVFKARKIMDGRLYAVKKITQKSDETLSEILREARLLSQMNHPSVVRYHNTWMEVAPKSELDDGGDDSSTSGTDSDDSQRTVSQSVNVVFAKDSESRALDFMSSSGHPYTAEEESEEEDGGAGKAATGVERREATGNEEETASEDDGISLGGSVTDMDDVVTDPGDNVTGRDLVSPPRPRRHRRRRNRPRSMIFISMEYCEKRSLRDLISRNLYKETQEVWRLFRQILEGLVHIHGLNIIHRDLKPDNIFITAGFDGVENAKIGDFGLATTGQLAADKGGLAMDPGELTRSIGTASYLAPEVRTGGSGSYTSKVDMYSLGVIFFEMSYSPMMGMERAKVLEKIRNSPPAFPADFKPLDKNQTDVILWLLSHTPKDRPSSTELLKSRKLPFELESETIRRAIEGLADPDSPYFEKMLSALFDRQNGQTRDYAWDMSSHITGAGPSELMRRHITKDTLISIFRRHGAVEAPTSMLYPRSSYYGQNAVWVLDRNGTILQLPFDLVMGKARSLARVTNGPLVQRSFSFGSIFRDRHDGGQPDIYGEVDYDIVTADALDLTLKEAEVIKILDEIVTAFPTTSSTPMCFHLGHSDLLNLIFEFCGIPAGVHRAVADVLSKLNIRNFTWQKVRSELRSPLIGISATSLDELQRFDFRDTPTRAISKLKGLLEGTEFYQKASPTLAYIREVYEYTKRFGVSSKIYICPLSSINEAFFRGGILFACLYDKKVRDVFAAGGRYDNLIQEHRPKIGSRFEERHAVGFSLNWEKQLVKQVPKGSGKAFVKKAAEEEAQGIFSAKRCDVLVASFDPTVLRSSGLELLQNLWAHGISAELARDSRSPEDLLTKYRDELYSWMVIMKQDNVLKIKSPGRKDAPDVDIAAKELLSWLKSEIRDRDSRSIMKYRGPGAGIPYSESANAVEAGQEQNVHVLVAQTRSKKFNRRAVVEQAQTGAAKLVQGFLDGPIAAIETSDSVLDMIRTTSLSDPDSWRKVDNTVGNAEKKYVREIQDMLKAWRWEWESKKGPAHAFVYNFRTGKCIYYDLAS